MASKPKSAARYVDYLSGSSTRAEIYIDANGLLWNAMLNYTDITYGQLGNNKFYSVQLIQDCAYYKVFRKWGRVGAASPQYKIEPYTSLDSAMAAFKKRFAEKSGNRWPLDGPFVMKKGKYALVELAGDDEDAEMVDEEEDPNNGAPECTLPDKVQELLQLIGDTTLIAQEVSALNFDMKRMPLGRLSKAQISQGYTLLQRLSDTLTEIEELENQQAAPTPAPAPTPAVPPPAPTPTTGRTTRRRAATATAASAATAATPTPKARAPRKKKPTKSGKARLNQLKTDVKTLTSEFYTLIPHNFGRSLPPTINTLDTVKNKIDLLQVLADIEISQQLQKDQKKNAGSAESEHPLDKQYKSINTEMEPLDENSDEYKQLVRFMESTQCPSQTMYNLKVHSILKIARPTEQEKRPYFEDIDNHRLLWHGSRLSNVVGILSQGLRIAPPEAPINGYNFGKGVYFADSVTKSAQYCWTSPSRPRAVLLLAEVALGKSYEALHGEYLDFKDVQARGCSSTLGVGRLAPKEETFEKMGDGTVIPIGQITPRDAKGGMLFNEFIVYKQEQVRLRYLITTDFLYNH